VQVGLALPTMADGWTRSTFLDWCRIADDGPFSSVSTGERITFHNPEVLTTLAASAALTERVRIMTNVVVTPWHATTLLAKQLATIDVISGGRLDVGVGVGARGQDYEAVEAPMTHRHQRLDDQVAELRRLWSGEPALPGAPPLGPRPVQTGGPPLYAGALGPKSAARAARWAVGVSGFSLNLDVDELNGAAEMAEEAWRACGRRDRPRLLTACFYALGPDSAGILERFTSAYFTVFGSGVAASMGKLASLSDEAALREALGRVAAETPIDEVILVPAAVAPALAERAAQVVADLDRGAHRPG
jgi:alkanesulfonate monooxygenase SsuD/methylene tetrahydromethanopterin reductase-like flavin-dependent oxidoreductase (luciferase family)